MTMARPNESARLAGIILLICCALGTLLIYRSVHLKPSKTVESECQSLLDHYKKQGIVTDFDCRKDTETRWKDAPMINPNTPTLQQDNEQLPYKGFVETRANDKTQLNRTKIVGFITESYKDVAMRWYDRLEALGYDNHYIIATDEEGADFFKTEQPSYRVETSLLPPWPEKMVSMQFGKKMRQRIQMLFAHRWIYTLQQLQKGHHVLITDVDNIFSRFYSMNELELSEYDVCHALETKHPEDVFDAQGFVFCGGMGWFRSSTPVIRFIQMVVDRCGVRCDDQVLLNRVIAFHMGIEWNRTEDHHSEVTVHTNDTNMENMERFGKDHFERIVGLVTRGFSGRSNITGHKVKVWDRDFAYRGKNDPTVCPENNWVTMPFVTFVARWQGPGSKLNSYDIWDKSCPNDYTRLMEARNKTATK